MTKKSVRSRVLRLTGTFVSCAGLTLAVLGCGDEQAAAPGPEGKAREEVSTKNMENFMKTGKPLKPAGAPDAAPKVQVK